MLSLAITVVLVLPLAPHQTRAVPSGGRASSTPFPKKPRDPGKNGGQAVRVLLAPLADFPVKPGEAGVEKRQGREGVEKGEKQMAGEGGGNKGKQREGKGSPSSIYRVFYTQFLINAPQQPLS